VEIIDPLQVESEEDSDTEKKEKGFANELCINVRH